MSTPDYKFSVTRKYGEPRRFVTFDKAKAAVVDDLKDLHHALAVKLQDRDSDSAIGHAIAAVSSLVEPPRGTQAIDLEVDPYTGTRYRAVIQRL